MARQFLFLINSIIIALALILISLGYIAPSNQGFLVGATLFVPGILVISIIFFVFWLLKRDKRVWLSIVFFACFFWAFERLFSVNLNETDDTTVANKFKIASFNTLYYRHQSFKEASINNFLSLFEKEKVAVFGLQEATGNRKNSYYSNTNYSSKNYSQNWVFSKHPIISSEVLDISSAKHKNKRSITYADVILKNDTIRVFNLHFESYRFSKDADQLQKQGVSKFRTTLDKVFKIHEKEVTKLIAYINKSPYPTIVLGDFNNNAFSYEYNQLIKKCNLKDTFVEAGNGFGSTFDFKYFPTRIDFILVPKTAKVYTHKVINKTEWSDHFPIIAEISL